MMTLDQLRRLCFDIGYRGEEGRYWSLVIGMDDGAFWLQWRFDATDTETGNLSRQHGRKWRISQHATPDEVVKTAWAAVQMAIQHEAAERFTYKREAIFHPHTDVEALVEVQRARQRVTREERA